jgi:hypothetical protein
MIAIIAAAIVAAITHVASAPVFVLRFRANKRPGHFPSGKALPSPSPYITCQICSFVSMSTSVETALPRCHFPPNVLSTWRPIKRVGCFPHTGETQTQVGVGVREDCLRELLDSRCTKRCALQWRSQNCLRARAWNSSSPLNLVFVTASYFGSENGIF